MDLPSFLWLWKIAAWSMGLALVAYCGLAFTGWALFRQNSPQVTLPAWWRSFHIILGLSLLFLVLALLAIGIVGTLGHYGSLGHSPHGVIGVVVVGLTLASGWAALQIRQGKAGARTLHLRLNLLLGVAMLGVLFTGWLVVQKYLS